jgi:hypothetical protein
MKEGNQIISNDFTVKEIIGPVMYYCRVNISITVRENSSGFALTIEDGVYAKPWLPAIKFAVQYFYEHYNIQIDRYLAIHINELRTLAVDSTNSIVFYSLVKCMSEALNYKELVFFNKDNGRIEMLK